MHTECEVTKQIERFSDVATADGVSALGGRLIGGMAFELRTDFDAFLKAIEKGDVVKMSGFSAKYYCVLFNCYVE